LSKSWRAVPFGFFYFLSSSAVSFGFYIFCSARLFFAKLEAKNFAPLDFTCPSFQYQPSKSTIKILLFIIFLLFFIGENGWLAACAPVGWL
jgi:hypothetical protein